MRANRPSLSAAKTGRVPVYMARHPRYGKLLPARAAETAEKLLRSAGLLKPWMISLFDTSWFLRYMDRMEGRTAPGLSLHVSLRKRFLDDETRRAIAEGITQVLAVGAGYDTLCVRLAEEFPHVSFFEIDHPPTHAVKRDAVERMGAARPNLFLLGVDLEHKTLGDLLSALDPWSNEVQSAVVAEGVLMYLERPAVAAFFDAVRNHVGLGSRLLFTYMLADEHGNAQLGDLGWLIRLASKIAGEHLKWGTSPEEVDDLLRPHGLRYGLDPQRFDLRQRYLAPAGLAGVPLSELEQVAVAYLAERDTN